jgi:hypothetical protein
MILRSPQKNENRLASPWTVILNEVKDLLLLLTTSKPITSRFFVAALLRMTLRQSLYGHRAEFLILTELYLLSSILDL